MPSCDAVAVLIVDDDASFRIGVAANLRDDGHVVHECEDPREVGPEGIAASRVMITDYHMAEIDGITFADRVHHARPELLILLVTAYWTVEVEAAVAARPYLHLCRKPVDYDDLHERIHSLAV